MLSKVHNCQREDWGAPGVEYSWTDGNYGCDCNRAIFFAGDDDADITCGSTAYSIRVTDSKTGAELYNEFTAEKQAESIA